MVHLKFDYARRSWDEMLVSIIDYNQTPETLFEGTFKAAHDWLRLNNYTYVHGTNGYYLQTSQLTKPLIIARIVSLWREIILGRLARFTATRRIFGRTSITNNSSSKRV